MIRKLLLSTAFAAIATASMAADLPNTKGPAPFIAPMPIFTWTGFYAGLDVGGVWGNTRHTFDNAAPTDTSHPNGVIGGLYAGYNQQFGAIVVGIEGDINAVGARGSYINNTGATSSGSTKSDWQGDIRARLGYAVDRALFYVAGGAAFSDLKYGGGPGNLVPASILCCGFSKQRTGWTLGAGVDYAFTNNWIARFEYRYTDFGSSSGALVPTYPAVNMGVRTRSNAVLAGIAYKF